MSEREPITCLSMLDLVPLRWWTEFKRFVQEGEASNEFLEFYETSEACQKAFDLVLRQDPVMKALLAVLGECPDVDAEISQPPPVSA